MQRKYFYCLGLILSILCLLGFFSGGKIISAVAHLLPNNTSKQIFIGKLKTEVNSFQTPISFEINQGQFNNKVQFLSRAKDYALFLTSNEAIFSLPSNSIESSKKIEPGKGEIVRMKLIGANKASKVVGLNKLSGVINYFIGNDSKKWHTNIPTYEKVAYKNIYSGIDLVYYGNQERLEYDLVVAPGVDPNKIRIKFDGIKKAKLDKEGNINLIALKGSIQQFKPKIYQIVLGVKKEIKGNYILGSNNEIAFNIEKYDQNRPLVIDPEIVFATYFGSSISSEAGPSITTDIMGNVYISGHADLEIVPPFTDFPISAEAFQGVPTGTRSYDVQNPFVSKFDPSGNLIYSTFLGGVNSFGLGGESARDIACDAEGNAYVTGITNTTDFPITEGAFQSMFKGNYSWNPYEIFVSKLSSDGSSLIYSTYIGSRSSDISNCIEVDTLGNAYIAGESQAGFSANHPERNFPTTPGVIQPSPTGQDAFILKVNPTGTGLVYSTFLGGQMTGTNTNLTEVVDIAIDEQGNLYATGWTESEDLPVTPGVFQPQKKGKKDAFVAKLNSDASQLLYLTYLGGSEDEREGGSDLYNKTSFGIQVDMLGNAYVAGLTHSPNFPVTENALNRFNYNNTALFITKLDPTASSLIFSTYFLGSNQAMLSAESEGLGGIDLDSEGNLYIFGHTDRANRNLPVTPDAFSPVPGEEDKRDVFISVLSPDGTMIIYSTYYGRALNIPPKVPNSTTRSSRVVPTAISLDSSNNICITGEVSYISDLELVNPYQDMIMSSAMGQVTDAFITKISAVVTPTTVPVTAATTSSSSGSSDSTSSSSSSSSGSTSTDTTVDSYTISLAGNTLNTVTGLNITLGFGSSGSAQLDPGITFSASGASQLLSNVDSSANLITVVLNGAITDGMATIKGKFKSDTVIGNPSVTVSKIIAAGGTDVTSSITATVTTSSSVVVVSSSSSGSVTTSSSSSSGGSATTSTSGGSSNVNSQLAQNQLNKVLSNLTIAGLKLASSSKSGRSIKSSLTSIIRDIKNAKTKDGCEDSILASTGTIQQLAQQANTKACVSNPLISGMISFTGTKDCIPRSAVNNFVNAVDKASGDIISIIGIDSDGDSTPDVCE